ncbi:OLC1v1015090C1 [Oldenlandia corymbosa var. corymbosa]|uniref:protein-serine/threonine phosphatase n=1 Tax=Oldenlandia corymbosa var. corymbosa TaxID=529605 RepID=A0AAV1E2L3_OLDCO|nr:OLC1v1015090C1 [Oldenlandia corymbosa var. corymbosa]
MEEMSPPAVAVTLGLGGPMCDNSTMSNHMEITRLKIVTDTAILLSDSASLLDADSSSSWDGNSDGMKAEGSMDMSLHSDSGSSWNGSCSGTITGGSTADMLLHAVSSSGRDGSCNSTMTEGTIGIPEFSQVVEKPQNDEIVVDVIMQESEEEEILLVRDDHNKINGVEVVPLETRPEISLPIAVEIEGIDNGQIVAKVISLEERDVVSTAASTPIDDNPKKPKLKASFVALQLPNEKEPIKGNVKSVYELECLPLWGSASICGERPEMEDAVMVAPHFMRIPIKMLIGDRIGDGVSQTLTHLNSHFFGVYDGHGGSQIANYCRDRIHLALSEEVRIIKDDSLEETLVDTRQLQWEKVFSNCFLKVDDEVGGNISRTVSPDCGADACIHTSEPVAPETVGSTAVVAVLCSSHIIVANCGDSRAVLYRGKEAIPLSVDHKPNREDEYARIEASGGKVIQWNGYRVYGVLAMSRSIGDRYLKPSIIPNPEVTFLPRAREDECLILASDGLWDVMTNEEACEVARKRILIWHKKNGTNPLPERGQGVDPAAQAAADYLSMLALQKGSRDNVSVIVVDLKAQRKFKTKS